MEKHAYPYHTLRTGIFEKTHRQNDKNTFLANFLFYSGFLVICMLYPFTFLVLLPVIHPRLRRRQTSRVQSHAQERVLRVLRGTFRLVM